MSFIEIQKLSKVFQGTDCEVVALRDIDLSIEKGSIFGIIGMSGAGKSTLVRCINFLERPSSGTVVINGRDLGSMSAKALRKEREKIGMIFQQFNLMMQASVLDNVMFPMLIRGEHKKTAKEKALSYLKVVDLEEKANAYPAQLSGGQKQRVAIARTLACQPEVLLCDEATSALDPKTTKSILELLVQINRDYGITIIVITHEMSIIEEICTDVAIIADSAIAETGKVKDVFANPTSEIGRNLILSGRSDVREVTGSRLLRVVFDGRSSFEPVLANVILETGAHINILYANTANVGGEARGQMVIQLPEDPLMAQRVADYLREKEIVVEELEEYVGE